MLRGSVDWYKQPENKRLAMPSVVKDSTSEYLNENDIVGQWLTARTRDETGFNKHPRTEMYNDFLFWCDDQQIEKTIFHENKVFYATLQKKGYEIGTGGKRKVQGLRLAFNDRGDI